MNVELEIKKQILIDALKWNSDNFEMPSDENVIEFYDENKYEIDDIQDCTEEFRGSGIDCDLSCSAYSRHYECEQNVKKLDNGLWVSFVYWHGGGKHGEPEAMNWIDDAFFVECEEKEVVTIQRTFKPAG